MNNFIGKLYIVHRSHSVIIPKKLIKVLGWDYGTRVFFQVIDKDELRITRVKLPNEKL